MEVLKGDEEASKGIRHLRATGKMQERVVKERRSGAEARQQGVERG